MAYVDGFVVPVKKERLAEYIKIAKGASKLWIEHGALEYLEAVGDHLDAEGMVPFGKGVRQKPDETVVFAYIVYKSRAHRDRVNKKVMADPRIMALCDPKNTPFDFKRMQYGGFKGVVSAKAKAKK
jgi:uncharacterized protein YbaA (DUF1428 family)